MVPTTKILPIQSGSLCFSRFFTLSVFGNVPNMFGYTDIPCVPAAHRSGLFVSFVKTQSVNSWPVCMEVNSDPIAKVNSTM